MPPTVDEIIARHKDDPHVIATDDIGTLVAEIERLQVENDNLKKDNEKLYAGLNSIFEAILVAAEELKRLDAAARSQEAQEEAGE